MRSVTVRNIEDDVFEELKIQAKQNNRSLEAELRQMFTEQANRRRRRTDLVAQADRIAAMTPDVPQTDSTLLIREDRDR